MSKAIDDLFLKELLRDKMSFISSECKFNQVERIIDKGMCSLKLIIKCCVFFDKNNVY